MGYNQMKTLGFDLSYFRLPIVDEKAPLDIDFDAALTAMRQTDPDSACVFNCQMGKGRTTTGMILACLVKDIIHGDQSKKYYVDDTVGADFGDDDEIAEEKARRGQFSVISKIFEYIPEAKEGKA